MPKRKVGIRPPPSLALLALSGAMTPRISPLPKCSTIFAGLDDVTVGDPIHHRPAQTGYESDDDADDGAAQDNEFMAQRIFDTIQPALAEFGLFRNRAPLDQQIDDLGKGKQSQPDDDQGNPVHEVVDSEGIAVLGDRGCVPMAPSMRPMPAPIMPLMG